MMSLDDLPDDAADLVRQLLRDFASGCRPAIVRRLRNPPLLDDQCADILFRNRLLQTSVRLRGRF